MRVLSLSLIAAALLAAGAALAAPPQTEDEKTFYALGLSIARNLAPFSLSAPELGQVMAGLSAGIKGEKPAVDLDTYGPKIGEIAEKRRAAMGVKVRQAGSAYQVAAAQEYGARKTPSGLIYREIKAGTGAQPTKEKTVKVHYHGTLVDGTVFDSSRDRGEPVSFPLGQVVPCWQEGVSMMKAGGKAKLVCPPEIAYGERGAPPVIPPGATLIFEVELLSVE